MGGKTKGKEQKPVDAKSDQVATSEDGPDPEHVARGRAIVEELASTLWLPDGLSAEEQTRRFRLALDRLHQIEPRGQIEGLLAAQMVATHSAAMDCLRRAMLDGQTFEGRNLNLKHATKLLSLYARQVEVLDKHRGKGQQKVIVEHVHVESGGQAIVGNVESGGAKHGRQRKAKGPAIEHAPEVPLETPAPAASKVKVKVKAKG